jgi:OmpA-OmpF porin, OOP family
MIQVLTSCDIEVSFSSTYWRKMCWLYFFRDETGAIFHYCWVPQREVMRMNLLRVFIVLLVGLLNICEVQASGFSGAYLGVKLGVNNSSATDTSGVMTTPSQRSVAYFLQGGYLQGGYNLDLSAVVVGVGAYWDWNPYAKHDNGVEYSSHSYGFDAKLGVPLGNWMPYAKLGRGRNVATDDFSGISQTGPNSALGFEYKLADHWSTIGEYKVNKFSSQDGSITIKNKTFTFGFNYYFDEPPKQEIAPEPEPEPIPELAPIPEPVGPEPGSPAPAPVPAPVLPPTQPVPPVSEVWKTFMEDKAVRIEGTNFVRGSSKLELLAGKELMKDVVDFVGAHPDAKLELIGYTDSRGTEKLNQNLSLARAESVKKYLVGTGIAADRITIRGAGSSNPIGDNKTPEGRAQNRRVEIRSVIQEEKKIRVAG